MQLPDRESGSQKTLIGLSVLGYDLRVVGPYAEWVGGGQAVLHDSATGVNYGASDPRKDGEAVPQPSPAN